jgi:hypothetical protein
MIPNGCFERVCLVISVLLVSHSSPGPEAKGWNTSKSHLARFMPWNQNLRKALISAQNRTPAHFQMKQFESPVEQLRPCCRGETKLSSSL